jgi:hypothetical protein
LGLSFRFIIGKYLGGFSALSEKISWCITLVQGKESDEKPEFENIRRVSLKGRT